MTKNLTKELKKKKGFTLIELIIVVAIIAILAGLAIPKLMGTQDNAKRKADIANGKVIHDTTAKLLTEGKITETMVDGGVSFEVEEGDADSVNRVLWDELQSKPKVTYKGHEGFFVTIDEDKNITITVDGTGTSDDVVYPTPTGDYEDED